MNIKDENMEWELEAPLLVSLTKTTPYTVPNQYFSDLSARINQSVFVDSLMQKDSQGFTVPQNYFEDLGKQIESRIAEDQIKSLAPTSGFKAPANYFDKLNAEILNKTTSPLPKTKIVRLWGSDLMKYASAACFIILVASGLYLNEKNAVSQNRNLELASEQMLYDIDESVILEHIQETQHVTSTPASNSEIESYILTNYSANDLVNNL